MVKSDVTLRNEFHFGTSRTEYSAESFDWELPTTNPLCQIYLYV